ncbi:MAG: hypothetical protein Fur002_16650 [Anaerolineales bacterium]
MQSRQNSFSPANWKEFPEAGWLAKLRLIAPAPVGIYGEPRAAVALMSNHEAALCAAAAAHSDLTVIALDGGGYPTEVAASLGLLATPPDTAFLDYVREVKGEAMFYIPPCLSQLWGWRDGESHLGGVVRVTSEFYPPACGETSFRRVRLSAFLRLAFSQSFLLLVSMAVFGFLRAALPSFLFLWGGMAALAMVWGGLPANTWVKSGVVGAIFAVLYLTLVFLEVLSSSPFFAVGIFLLLTWQGGLLRGAAAEP